MIHLGIDVSKAKLHACLLDDQGKSKTKVVENSLPGVALDARLDGPIRGRP